MLGRLFKKLFSKKDQAIDVTEKSFGNVVKFRIGSLISINPVFFELIDDSSMFKVYFGDRDFNGMVVNTILSFEFDGTKIWRLYCDNPQSLLQVQEEGDGSISYMLFMLTQEQGATNRQEYEENLELLKKQSIINENDENNEIFTKVFGPLDYIENVEINGTKTVMSSFYRKSMSLFDRDCGDSVEYMLFDANIDDWWLEGFVGINIPSEEVTIN